MNRTQTHHIGVLPSFWGSIITTQLPASKKVPIFMWKNTMYTRMAAPGNMENSAQTLTDSPRKKGIKPTTYICNQLNSEQTIKLELGFCGIFIELRENSSFSFFNSFKHLLKQNSDTSTARMLGSCRAAAVTDRCCCVSTGGFISIPD